MTKGQEGASNPEALLSSAAQLWLGLVFAGLAGWMDAVGYIEMGQFYVSFMSGNTTQLGIAIAGAHRELILRGLFVIFSFFLGAFVGTLLSDAGGRFRTPLLLATELLLFCVAIRLTAIRPGFSALLPIVVAMGMQNALRQMVGHAVVGRSFVTGALFSSGQSLARSLFGAAPRTEWLVFLTSWIGFVLGAAGGAYALLRAGVLANLYGVAALLGFLAFAAVLSALDSFGEDQPVTG